MIENDLSFLVNKLFGDNYSTSQKEEFIFSIEKSEDKNFLSLDKLSVKSKDLDQLKITSTFSKEWEKYDEILPEYENEFNNYFDIVPQNIFYEAGYVADIGCGKGYLVKELSLALNSKNIYGLDISRYAINKSPKIIRKNLKIFDARKKINLNKKFDLVISINLIHNFELKDVFSFLKNILSISKKSYISTESYRNEKELYNLQCWALTCESFFSNKEWKWILSTSNYNRDYELIYFT